MKPIDAAWSLLKNLDDRYVDGTSPQLYGFAGDSTTSRSFHDYMDNMIRQGFKQRGLDPRHFDEWKSYDESVGSEIEGTELPDDTYDFTDEGWEARLALRDILSDLAEQHRAIGPEGDWRKVQPSIVADEYAEYGQQ